MPLPELPDGPQPLGVDRVYEITPPTLDADGSPITFTPSDTLAAKLWAGQDQSPLATPAVAWKDSTARKVILSVNASHTANLAPGRYRLRVNVTPVADGRTRLLWDGAIDLDYAPGSATPPPVYCSYNDLLDAAKFVAALLDEEEGDLAGFARERGRARAWFDDLCYRHLENSAGQTRHERVLYGRGARRSGLRSVWLKNYLDANALLVTPAIVECVAAYAVHLICKGRVTASKDNPYRALSAQFLADANTLASAITAEIDTDGDGLGNAAIDLGSTVVLRG